MKKIIKYSLFFFSFLVFVSCEPEIDNYDAPVETLTGTITDLTTGQPLLTSVSKWTGTRYYLTEVSYSENAIEREYHAKEDGTYSNTALFDATYELRIAGAFTAPDPVTLDIQGHVVHDFEVTPFVSVNGLSAVRNGDNIDVTFTLNKNGTDGGDIKDVKAVTSRYPYMNTVEFDYRGSGDASIVDTPQTVSFNEVNGNGSATGFPIFEEPMYIRVYVKSSKSGSFSNWSEMIMIE